MKRAAPFVLYAGVTLAVFWRFILFGQTMYAVPTLEAQFGTPSQQPRGWFVSAYRHTRISDNAVLLPGHFRRYNAGLKSGELRLWNPSLFCGLPAYSDPMLHPFYPPNLLLHGAFSPDVGYELAQMLHLFFAGVAMHLLLGRGLGRSPIASTLGALVWMLAGYNGMWFSTAILSGVSVFGPLTLLAILRGLETKDRSRAALAAAAMGMAILGSHPQHAVLSFLLLVAWIAAEAVRVPENRSFTLRFGAIFVLLSIGVGLAEILARLDTIENGYRDPVFDRLYFYGEPWRLATYLAGLILGKVYYPGAEWEAEFSVHVGLAAASLSVIGAVRHWKDPRVRFFAVSAAAVLTIAFILPLAWIYGQIPILNLSPASRCLVLAPFSIAVLTAFGADAIATRPGRAHRGVAGIAAAFAIGTLLGIGPARLSNGAAIETALGFALASAAALAAARWRKAAGTLAIAAVLFELLPPFIQFNGHGDSSALERVPEPVLRMRAPEASWRGTGLLGTTATGTGSDEWQSDLLAGNNLLALYGVNNIAGFEAIAPRRYVSYAHLAGATVSPAGRSLVWTKFDSPLVDNLALRYVLLPGGLRMPPKMLRMQDFGTVSLFENRAALPRARLAPSCRTVTSEAEAEQFLRDPTFDPRTTVVIEGDRAFPDSRGGEVTWKENAPDRIVLEVGAKGPACLVLSDTDYPGWEATVDDRPTPIFRANLAFRAIEVPAGAHRVEFRFRPSAARHGLIASTLFLLLSLGAPFYRRKRTGGGSAPSNGRPGD